MRDLFLKRLTLPDGEGRPRSYDYYITVDEMDVGRFFCESYGIRVEEEGGICAEVHGITCSISRMDALCELVLRNGVTPPVLADVVSDWL